MRTHISSEQKPGPILVFPALLLVLDTRHVHPRLLFPKAALPGEHHICCQVAFVMAATGKTASSAPFCASSGIFRRIIPTPRPI